METESQRKPISQGVLFMAEANAAICREFLQITADGTTSLRQAAMFLGKSPSFFSGENSYLVQFQRGGVAALVPKVRERQAANRFEVPPWFIPAAKFLYLISNLRRDGGSVPEAVRRVISLPNLPHGWTDALKARFLKAINLAELPTCPIDLRERILAREYEGKDLVPKRIARQIAVDRASVQWHRSPRAWALDNLCAPGSQRRHFNAESGQREIMQPGDWFGGDDSTPGVAVCVPCNEVVTRCSENWGVLIGRFQWLVFHDARTDKILAWDYVIRPRGSYRAEDVLGGMLTVTRTHGVPRKGWQFEGGIFNAKLIRQAIALLNCEHFRTYSPHQKAIESIFNRVWTRLSVQFPHADMGRYCSENESNCRVYEQCKKGHQDPRRFFPMLADVVKVFEQEIAWHNSKRIFSEQYGNWQPDGFFHNAIAKNPLRKFSPEMEWIFSPYACERQILGMFVKCRVPMFEGFSVPFEFSAPWMPLHCGKKVRVHFNPREPYCKAKIVLLENSGMSKPGDILGDADLIGETAAYFRHILNWAKDDPRAGYIARQKTNHFARRVSHGIGVGGRTEYAADEERDGLATITKIESGMRMKNEPIENKTEAPAVNEPKPEIDMEYFRARSGKIARLPSDLRRQINVRLYNGESAPIILPWLNGLPEVKKILAEQFDGRPISPPNLSSWRRGAFRAWVANFESHKMTGLTAISRMLGKRPAPSPRS